MSANTLLLDDAQALRRCVRELAALSTLSAAWAHSDVGQIAAGLSSVVLRSLPLSLACVRVRGVDGGIAAEAARTPRGPLPAAETGAISRALNLASTNPDPGEITTIPHPFGGGTMRVLVLPIGYGGDCGHLFAGSSDPGFPTHTDRLMLGVAVNQAAIVLQQKRSDDQIRRREAELADFFDNATVGLHWVAGDGTILRANRAELNLLGYSADEYIGHHIAEFHVDRPVIDDILRRLWNGEHLRDVEARLRCRDGSIKHVVIDSSVLWEDGRFIHTRCFTRDITEQKRSEESRRRLAAIVESSQDAIIGTDLTGTITSWNPGAERLYGHAAAAIIGRPISTIIPADHQDDFQTLVDRLARGEPIDHYETVRLHKDGRRVDVSMTVSPIRDADGTLLGVSKVARDITERRREQDALKTQTERLGLLWEAASVLLSADEPDAMLRGLFAKIGPHLGADVYFTDTASQGGDAQPVESPGLRAHACRPLRIGDRLLGTLSFASRTRDRFDADEVAFIETVSHYVTVAYERLRLLDELRESDRRKDEFLATLAHELRNPLAPIRSAVKVLHLKGADNPEARRGREIIERQVEHLTRLVDDLLEISRITRNELELRKRPVALSEVINGAIEASRPLIEASGHQLHVGLPAEPVYLEGDLVRLAQVFLNLLNNAAKYTERGGRIRLTAEREGDSVVVRVTDTGVGILPDKLPRLFEMFYQVDRSLERAQGGLGIGLSLVRRLVEFHGGTVEARSEGIGKGSEFIVTLPVGARQPESRPAPSFHAAENRPHARILVADDNRDSAECLSMFLKLNGIEIVTAYDGVEAVEAAERFKPDVVLLDIGMPRLNGEDACRRIRATPWGRDILVVALTGWGQEEDRRRTVDAGFNAHLVKPIDPEEVMKLLASRRPAGGG